jgi:leucyl aminopeptidase
MPLWEGYRGRLESTVADICHTGSSREGGAIVAALFLEHFISEGTRWAHLDIAGEDWVSEAKPLCPKGASGFAARTLLELGRGGFE